MTLANGAAAKLSLSEGFTALSMNSTPLVMVGAGSKRTTSGLRVSAVSYTHLDVYKRPDMLWQSFYAASLSPSYLNRQPYGFLVQDHSIYLVQQEDAYTDNLDAALDLGIVMLHFSAVASQWAGRVRWELSPCLLYTSISGCWMSIKNPTALHKTARTTRRSIGSRIQPML